MFQSVLLSYFELAPAESYASRAIALTYHDIHFRTYAIQGPLPIGETGAPGPESALKEFVTKWAGPVAHTWQLQGMVVHNKVCSPWLSYVKPILK